MTLQKAISQYQFATYSVRELVVIVKKIIGEAKLVQHQSMPIDLANHELGRIFAAAVSCWCNVYTVLRKE